LLDSIVKERWLILSSQPRRAFYSSLIFRQAISKISFLLSTACAFVRLGASRQREANSTAFQPAVNLILQPLSLHSFEPPTEPNHRPADPLQHRSYMDNRLIYKPFSEIPAPEEGAL